MDTQHQPDFAELTMSVDGDGAHYDHRVDDDHWEQPGSLFRKMTKAQTLAERNLMEFPTWSTVTRATTPETSKCDPGNARAHSQNARRLGRSV
jgi:catalase